MDKITEIECLGGDHLYNVLVKAVEQAPARFTFNAWTFETHEGETLGDARQRFESEHGFVVTTPEEDAEQARKRLDETEAKQAAAIADAKVPTEAELREQESPWCDTPEELTAYISGLVDRPHDYGTCVYAMSLAAVAAFRYVARKLGTTGFQAGCADLDILRQTRGFKWGRILDYESLLYPQYCDDEHFPSAASLLRDPKVREHLATLAKEKLAEAAEAADAHPNIAAHWKMLAELTTP